MPPIIGQHFRLCRHLASPGFGSPSSLCRSISILTGLPDNLYRESAPSGQRLYLFPRITLLPFRNSYLQTTLFAGAHIRGYATDKRDSNSEVQASDGDLLPEAGVRRVNIADAHLRHNFPAAQKNQARDYPGIQLQLRTGTRPAAASAL